MENDTIRQDVTSEDFRTGEPGADEFLKRWIEPDGASPSGDDEETPPDSDEDEQEDGDSLPDGDSEDDDGNEPHEDDQDEGDTGVATDISDDTVIKRKIDGEEVELRIGDLVKARGLEQAALRKTQELAEKRKVLDTHAEQLVARASKALTNARERFEPYRNIDWVSALHEYTPDEFKALRADAERAYQDVQVYESDLKGTLDEAKSRRDAQFEEYIETTAKSTHDFFARPDSPIPNYSEALVDEMFDYAVKEYGIPMQEAHSAVEPWKIQLFHDAMMFRKGRTAVQKTAVVTKTNNKVVKSRVNSDASRSGEKTDRKALEKFKKSGGSDSTDAWLDLWRDD